MTNVICSTTESVWVNRASHAVKVSLATVVVLSVFSRLKPHATMLKWGVAASNLSFSAPWLVATAHCLADRSYLPVRDNALLNGIWGRPQTKRARLQFPLLTGLEIAALMTCGLKSGWPRAAALIGLGIRAKALWGVLSIPPDIKIKIANKVWTPTWYSTLAVKAKHRQLKAVRVMGGPRLTVRLRSKPRPGAAVPKVLTRAPRTRREREVHVQRRVQRKVRSPRRQVAIVL